ncbi:hypothetical protein WI96_09690 [Burkholderia vietnamiensis]|uniref:hypothetical protein n=1 Tax=Burkholderia vietnamiensis TaxID=60552 RepID=UPI00075E83AE|nr:hypothetical protein [Burkholderia vietnamiensis]KVE67299.1 hypothetical protein WI96_09690 [Burkholderia vietnamiensis]MBR8219035.1 hypothetical protein [Burkholderia vietnamiensis]MCA8229032.1 hypothetical protein [Burkholderia vietnamiensis]
MTDRDEEAGALNDPALWKDWRLQATAELAEPFTPPWNPEVTYAKGSLIKQAGQFPVHDGRQLTLNIPNATALFLNISHRNYVEARAVLDRSGIRKGMRKNVTFSVDADAFHYLECFMTSVVGAYTAVEAFANETIPDNYIHVQKYKDAEERLVKADIERRLTLSKKMMEILPAALSIQTPKGKKCWDEFHRLELMRERIIHMKSADRNMNGPARGTVWEALFKFPEPVSLALPILEFFARQMDVKRLWATDRPF